MQPFGIYTLVNDALYDQLIAFLNGIRVNVGSDVPVCVIPFDHRCDRIQSVIDERPNVTLFQDQSALERWEAFAHQFVSAHPAAQQAKQSHARWFNGKLHRRYVAFEGPFEQFVFFDGDCLAMKPLTGVLEKLKAYDFVFDDWEHAKPTEHAALNLPLIEATGLFTVAEVRPKLHCSSFFGSKRGLFDVDELAMLRSRLVEGEAAWVNGRAWWDDAFLFNYMTLRSARSQFNFTQSENGQDRTGNCADSDPFVAIDQVLYNQQELKPIHRIHYMGYSCAAFARLCQGEAVEIPHRDVFLHYRFLDRPEQKPSTLMPPNLLTRTHRSLQKVMRKLR